MEPQKVHLTNFPESVDNWDYYFLWMAEAVSIKSKDEHCRVGAVITSKDHVVLSTGFNGLARGVYDDKALLESQDEKLKVICHAEANAILNAARMGVRLEGASIYVNKFPCLTCCNAIIQAGIKRIYTHDTTYWKNDPFDKEQTRKPKVLRQGGITVDAPFHPDFSPQAPISLKVETVEIAVEKKEMAKATGPASGQGVTVEPSDGRTGTR